MKKFFILILTVLAVAVVLTSCGAETTSDQTATIPVETEAQIEPETEAQIEPDLSKYWEVEPKSSNLPVYRAYLQARLAEEENLLSDEDWSIIEETFGGSGMGEHSLNRGKLSFRAYSHLFNELSEYYYPVIFRNGNSLILWYTTENGTVLVDALTGFLSGGNLIGDLHKVSGENFEEILGNAYNNAYYCQETGKFIVSYFGEIVDELQLPEEAVYCGFSAFEGHIFRHGGDVYALRLGTQMGNGEVVCLAHNVKYVVDAGYSFGSDPWSQPLFLMEDGSLRAYVSWIGDGEVDDPSHLSPLQYEGGYR